MTDPFAAAFGIDQEGIWWRGQRQSGQPTADERDFVRALVSVVGDDVDFWLHEDARGPWLLVSMTIGDTPHLPEGLRLDFDPAGIRGGWSQFHLCCDDGVRAEFADVDFDGPEGIRAAELPIDELAQLAATWFKRHEAAWRK